MEEGLSPSLLLSSFFQNAPAKKSKKGARRRKEKGLSLSLGLLAMQKKEEGGAQTTTTKYLGGVKADILLDEEGLELSSNSHLRNEELGALSVLLYSLQRKEEEAGFVFI